MGIVVRYLRYLKPIIIAGFCIDVCVPLAAAHAATP